MKQNVNMNDVINFINNNPNSSDLYESRLNGIVQEQTNTIVDNGVTKIDISKYSPLSCTFSECISNITFNDKNEIFVILTDFSGGRVINELTDELLDQGANLKLINRNGIPIANYEFNKCKLKSINPIYLSYDINNYVISRQQYIIVITFENISKITI
jgi:hypothetical protein